MLIWAPLASLDATTGATQAARIIFVGVYFHCRRMLGVKTFFGRVIILLQEDASKAQLAGVQSPDPCAQT